MSRNVKYTKNSAPIQKFCKVCQDAGKSESEYRSHFTRETRDPNSRVVCPTLLALECRYCFKKGHTVKYCAVLKEKDRVHPPERKEARNKAVEKPKGKSTNKNVFNVVDSDSEEDVLAHMGEGISQVNEEFPALPTPSLTRNHTVSNNYVPAFPNSALTDTQGVSTNYLAALAKPAPPAPKAESRPAPWASGVSKASKMDWAAWDSESEDEEDSISYDSYKPYYFSVGPANDEIEDEDW